MTNDCAYLPRKPFWAVISNDRIYLASLPITFFAVYIHNLAVHKRFNINYAEECQSDIIPSKI